MPVVTWSGFVIGTYQDLLPGMKACSDCVCFCTRGIVMGADCCGEVIVVTWSRFVTGASHVIVSGFGGFNRSIANDVAFMKLFKIGAFANFLSCKNPNEAGIQAAVKVQSCFTSTDTIRPIRDGKRGTATSTFTQLLSSGTAPY